MLSLTKPASSSLRVGALIARTVADVETALALLGDAHPSDAASAAFARHPYRPTQARACRILYAARFGDAPVDAGDLG